VDRREKTLRRMLRNRSGTAEIVGTVLFLVILFFFFSNVFLWHSQISQEMDGLIADKMNSAVRIEITAGQPVFDDQSHIIQENNVSGSYTLAYERAFYTNVAQSSIGLIKNLQLRIHAGYTDSRSENCYVAIYDLDQILWVGRMLTVNELNWYNITLSPPSKYVDTGNNGMVRIKFEDQYKGDDQSQGTLSIDYIEVIPGSMALEVTNLGGVDTALSRLWIASGTSHVYADLESITDSWVRGGSQRTIVLDDESGTNGQSISAYLAGDNIVVQYSPPSGQIVTFRVLTKLGNTAACSCSFP
jgi:hypothetical protein